MGDGDEFSPERVRALRERLGLTQAELAAVVDATPNSVRRWEAGIHRPHGVYARALRRLLGLPSPVEQLRRALEEADGP